MRRMPTVTRVTSSEVAPLSRALGMGTSSSEIRAGSDGAVKLALNRLAVSVVRLYTTVARLGAAEQRMPLSNAALNNNVRIVPPHSSGTARIFRAGGTEIINPNPLEVIRSQNSRVTINPSNND